MQMMAQYISLPPLGGSTTNEEEQVTSTIKGF